VGDNTGSIPSCLEKSISLACCVCLFYRANLGHGPASHAVGFDLNHQNWQIFDFIWGEFPELYVDWIFRVFRGIASSKIPHSQIPVQFFFVF
jgi:hypothetical protein